MGRESGALQSIARGKRAASGPERSGDAPVKPSAAASVAHTVSFVRCVTAALHLIATVLAKDRPSAAMGTALAHFLALRDVVWCGVKRCGGVWCGAVWCGA